MIALCFSSSACSSASACSSSLFQRLNCSSSLFQRSLSIAFIVIFFGLFAWWSLCVRRAMGALSCLSSWILKAKSMPPVVFTLVPAGTSDFRPTFLAFMACIAFLDMVFNAVFAFLAFIALVDIVFIAVFAFIALADMVFVAVFAWMAFIALVAMVFVDGEVSQHQW